MPTAGATVDERLAALDAAIAGVAGIDPGALERGTAAGLTLGLEVARTRLESVALRAIRDVDRRGAWVDDGAANAAGWLAAHTGQLRAEAGGRVNLARALPRMPLAAEALAGAAITPSHARVLARCFNPRTEARFGRDEAMLVGHARRHTADELARIVAYWKAHADPEGPGPSDGSDDELHLSRSLDGYVLRGRFGLETGAEVAAAIAERTQQLFHQERAQHEADPADHQLLRSPAQRRAAALAELVTRGAAASESTARRRPAFTVLIDWQTFMAGGGLAGERQSWPGGDPLHELDDGTVIPGWLAGLWRCDSHVSRAVMGADGQLLDLGRSTRTATDAQRRALLARDRGCAVPTCDRPPAWCDAHHIVWWEHGGSTDIDNLALLCRHHHRRVHTGHLHLAIRDGTPVVYRVDGTVLHHPRRPPPQPPPEPPRPDDGAGRVPAGVMAAGGCDTGG